MTTGHNFWDPDVWSFVIVLAILFAGMLAANTLRRRIPLLRKSLIPSSVLGGFLILIADWIYRSVAGRSMFDIATLEALTFHGLGLGFVALAWRKADGKRHEKAARRDVFRTSTVVVGSYLLQGIVGLTVTIPLFYLVGSYAAGGILLPMGYGQGPGQALNWGTIYQNYTMYPAFANGASFGLTVAAMGFVSASIGGVYYLNKLRRAGDRRAQVQNAEEIEDLNAAMITEKGEIPMSESMDKLTVQVAIVFVTYFIAFAAMWYVTKGLDSLGGFWVGTVKPLLWGFNFLVGTAFAILFKNILTRLRAKGIVHRDYINNFMLNRISGLFFDLMVTASIAAISLEAFKHREFILPLALICVAGAFVTYWYNIRVCRRLFPEYSDEAFLSLYGMNTGTASTGIILLREIDPLFETPASHNLIYQNLWSIVLGAPMLLLLGFVARSITWTWIVYGILYVLFGVMLLIQYGSKIAKKRKEK
jgi:ESS family glutamate:Na+ symporter